MKKLTKFDALTMADNAGFNSACTGVELGRECGVIGLAESSNRKPNDNGPVIMTSAVKIFDLLFGGVGLAHLCAYVSTVTSQIYIEAGVGCRFMIDLASNTWNGLEGYAPAGVAGTEDLGALPLVVQELLFGSNAELHDLFKQMLKAGKAGADEDLYYQFCDSLLYGLPDGGSETVTVSENSLTEAEVKAAFRSGVFQNAIKLDVPTNDFKQAATFLTVSEYEKEIPATQTASAPAQKRTRKKTSGKLIEECKKGKYAFNVPEGYWTEEEKALIPPLSNLDSYEPIPVFEPILRLGKVSNMEISSRLAEGLKGLEAIGNDACTVGVVGDPGNGKSRTLKALAAAWQIPFYDVSFSKNTDESIAQGMSIVDEEGKVRFVETPFLRAYTRGGLLDCEEANVCDPGVLFGIMSQATESPYVIMKNGYIPETRSPYCVMAITMNIGTTASKETNEALVNRMPVFETKPLDKKTTVSIVEKNTGAPEEVCSWLVDAYFKVKSYLEKRQEESLLMRISANRDCLQAVKNMRAGMSPKDAIRYSTIGHIYTGDKEVSVDTFNDVIDGLPDPGFNIAVEL